jgi:hypothetical protein
MHKNPVETRVNPLVLPSWERAMGEDSGHPRSQTSVTHVVASSGLQASELA